MIEGIDINQRIEYTLKSDTTEPKTVFVLRPLSGPEALELTTNRVKVLIGEGGRPVAELRMTAEHVRSVLKKCIIEIKDFKNFESIEKTIESLPPTALAELMRKITEINNLTEAERKNS